MKIIKEDSSLNDYRVVERFAFLPVMVYDRQNSMKRKIILFQKYYKLELSSHWGVGYVNGGDLPSLNKHEWDFKWSEAYLSHWKNK